MTSSPQVPERTRTALASMWSRRSIVTAGLAAGASGLAAAAVARSAVATPQFSAGLTRSRVLDPGSLAGQYRLVQRTTQGFARDVWDEVRQRGYDGFIDWQLDSASIDESGVEARLAAYPSLEMSARRLLDVYVATGQADVPPRELEIACVLHSVFGKRQLEERVVEMWTDHFNIDHAADECDVLKTVDDREVIRRHALGKFRDLLRASAHSGAMLLYLDNYSNQAAGVNENYAREVMELHTLAPGNYTETDVRELAHVLTGWTVWRQNDPAYGTFRFRPDWHATGTYTVLGRTFGPNGGQADGEAVLDMLAAHPATALRIAKKLCRWFLDEEPDKRAIAAVAREYLRTNGDIRAMLRVVLRPEHLLSASARPKLKRPFTFVVSLLRATRAVVTDPTALLDELELLGQLPYAWGPPDGYPDTRRYWGSAIVPRWSFASRLFENAIPGVQVDAAALFLNVAQQDAALRVNRLLSGENFEPQDVAAIDAYATSQPVFDVAVKREVLALAASSPSFQEI